MGKIVGASMAVLYTIQSGYIPTRVMIHKIAKMAKTASQKALCPE